MKQGIRDHLNEHEMRELERYAFKGIELGIFLNKKYHIQRQVIAYLKRTYPEEAKHSDAILDALVQIMNEPTRTTKFLFNWRYPYLVPMGTENISQHFTDGTVMSGSSGVWRQIPTPHDFHRRRSFGMDSYGDSVYIFGGYDEASVFNDFWRYNTKTGEWKKLEAPGAPSPRARIGFATDKSTGLAYVVGGYDRKSFFSEIFVYNIATNTWSTLRTNLEQLLRYCGVHVKRNHSSQEEVFDRLRRLFRHLQQERHWENEEPERDHQEGAGDENRQEMAIDENDTNEQEEHEAIEERASDTAVPVATAGLAEDDEEMGDSDTAHNEGETQEDQDRNSTPEMLSDDQDLDEEDEDLDDVFDDIDAEGLLHPFNDEENDGEDNGAMPEVDNDGINDAAANLAPQDVLHLLEHLPNQRNLLSSGEEEVLSFLAINPSGRSYRELIRDRRQKRGVLLSPADRFALFAKQDNTKELAFCMNRKRAGSVGICQSSVAIVQGFLVIVGGRIALDNDATTYYFSDDIFILKLY